MNDNKPTLPNAYVNINNRNLGLSPGLVTGIMAFTGVCQEGAAAFDAIVSLNKSDIASQIGYGELADELLDFFDAGGRKAIAVPLDITTEATGTGAMTPTRIGTSTGTIALDKVSGKKITIGAKVQIEITSTETATAGKAKFKYSLDGGVTFSPEIYVPATTYTIPGTNMELTFTAGAGPTEWEDGDLFDSTIGKPLPSTGDIEDAADAIIASDYQIDAMVIVPDCSPALGTSLQTKINSAEGKPDFRYAYCMVHADLAASDMSDLMTLYNALRATVENDRMQVVGAEAVMRRVNHGGCEIEKTCIGAIAGRRSALDPQNDLGRFDAGALANVLRQRTNMTETLIEDLDAIRVVTIRQFKGVAGYRPTNGWMTDPFSDIKKDAWRIVLDDASHIARITALGRLKNEVNPADIEGSTTALKNDIQNALGTEIVGKGRAVSVIVDIPNDQDIMTTETLLVDLQLLPYGHMSWIGITVAITNPATA